MYIVFSIVLKALRRGTASDPVGMARRRLIAAGCREKKKKEKEGEGRKGKKKKRKETTWPSPLKAQAPPHIPTRPDLAPLSRTLSNASHCRRRRLPSAPLPPRPRPLPPSPSLTGASRKLPPPLPLPSPSLKFSR